jgi:hypothetical protein
MFSPAGPRPRSSAAAACLALRAWLLWLPLPCHCWRSRALPLPLRLPLLRLLLLLLLPMLGGHRNHEDFVQPLLRQFCRRQRSKSCLMLRFGRWQQAES